MAGAARYRWPGNVRELQNVIEQAMWFARRARCIDVEQLPRSVRAAERAPAATRERRRQVADELYDALVSGGYSFWDHIHPLFLARDITRHDMRELVVRGLRTTRGNYRALLQLFGMPPQDYKRFLNFLATHDCRVDYRAFRQGSPEPARRPQVVLPPLRPAAPAPAPATPPTSSSDEATNV